MIYWNLRFYEPSLESLYERQYVIFSAGQGATSQHHHIVTFLARLESLSRHHSVLEFRSHQRCFPQYQTFLHLNHLWFYDSFSSCPDKSRSWPCYSKIIYLSGHSCQKCSYSYLQPTGIKMIVLRADFCRTLLNFVQKAKARFVGGICTQFISYILFFEESEGKLIVESLTQIMQAL